MAALVACEFKLDSCPTFVLVAAGVPVMARSRHSAGQHSFVFFVWHANLTSRYHFDIKQVLYVEYRRRAGSCDCRRDVVPGIEWLLFALNQYTRQEASR